MLLSRLIEYRRNNVIENKHTKTWVLYNRDTMTRDLGKPRGIIRSSARAGKFAYARHAPADDLGPFVEHFWIVRWDLRGQKPHVQETLPHPSVAIVVEQGHSGVFGVIRGRFTKTLDNVGCAFGIKFRPGGFYPFVRWPVSRITDRILSLSELFGEEGVRLETEILGHEEESKKVEIAENFLRERLPARDNDAETAAAIVAKIASDRSINKVEDLVNRTGSNARRLQRLFHRYVGVPPKWVIQRYRLHEAIERVHADEVVDWPGLALQLGYFDQAHFVRDFSEIVGVTPAAYAKNLRL